MKNYYHTINNHRVIDNGFIELSKNGNIATVKIHFIFRSKNSSGFSKSHKDYVLSLVKMIEKKISEVFSKKSGGEFEW